MTSPWCPGCGCGRTCDGCLTADVASGARERVADRILCLCTPTEPTTVHAPACEAAHAAAIGCEVLPPRLHRAVEQKVWERDESEPRGWRLAGVWTQYIPVETLPTCEVVLLDTETTGLSDRDRVIELGLVRADLATGAVLAERVQLVDPGIPNAAFVHNGIPDRDLRGKPRLVDIWPAVRDWIGARPVLAHNAGFDRKMIARECPDAEALDWRDTKTWARATLPGAPSGKLQELASYLKLPRGTAHRALGDARTLAALATRLYGLATRLPAPAPAAKPARAESPGSPDLFARAGGVR